jgi:hypothetical protein
VTHIEDLLDDYDCAATLEEKDEARDRIVSYVNRVHKEQYALKDSVDRLIRLAKDPWPRDETDMWKRGWNQAMEAVLRRLGAE